VAAFVWMRWQASSGLRGSFALDWVAGITGIRKSHDNAIKPPPRAHELGAAEPTMRPSTPRVKSVCHLSWLLTVFCFLSSSASAQTCVQPPTGLVSWWPGDGNADDIVDNNQGTLHNGATFADGMVGQAFRFDGVNSFVQAPTANLPTGNSDRTLELWVNLEAVVAEEAFFAGYGAFGEFDQTYHLGATGDTLFFSQWGDAIFGPSLQLGQWHHVAVSNVGNSATLYLNGTVVGNETLSINTPSGTQFLMGKIPELGDISRRLQGRVDEVSIYNRTLSAEEISAIFNAGRAGKCKETEVQEVTIDIKPGSSLNSINPKNNGVIPVAILTVAACKRDDVGLQTQVFLGQRYLRICEPTGQRSLRTSQHSRANGLQTGERANTPCEGENG
jgi:hypothetical protein